MVIGIVRRAREKPALKLQDGPILALKEKLISVPRRILLLIAPLAALTPFSPQSEFVAQLQTEPFEKLEAPTLTATSTGSTTVEISWTEVDGADHYDLRVWRNSDTGWERIEKDDYSGRTYIDYGLAAGKPDYYYIVAAVDAHGAIGMWSNQVRITAPGKLPAPKLTAKATISATIELTWTEVAGADRYELHTWWANDPGWQPIDDGLKGASYVHRGLTAGRTYYYAIRAIQVNGLEGEWSEFPYATVPETPMSTPTPTPTPTPTTTVAGRLRAPVLSGAYTEATRVELSWTEVSGADHYDLRVWKNSNTGWESIDEDSYAGRTYVDDVSAARSDYAYIVAAVDVNGVIGEWSEQVRISPPGKLPAPSLTAREMLTTTIELEWTEDSRADRYELLTWWAHDPGWQPVNDRLSGTSFEHRGLTPNRTYYYAIRAITANGVEGEWSKFASATVPANAQIPDATQRAALVALYDATDGANWAHSNNWLTNEPISTWYGVTLDSNGRVTELLLTGNRLRGSIPDLSALESLTILSLGSNLLSGSIPDFSALTALRILDLSFNQLTGLLPQLDALTNLEGLFLNNNRITGPLPDLSALTRLTSLSLGSNQFSGTIPDLSMLTDLKELYLTDSDLSGSIPDLSALTKLTALYLGNNRLTGSIPDITGLTNLTWLDLSHNFLEGPIPDLSALSGLTWLSVSRNQLTGQAPDLSALTKLAVLQLGHNRLTGPIPDLRALTNLTILDLAGNELCLPAGSSQADSNAAVAAHLSELNLPACPNALNLPAIAARAPLAAPVEAIPVVH